MFSKRRGVGRSRGHAYSLKLGVRASKLDVGSDCHYGERGCMRVARRRGASVQDDALAWLKDCLGACWAENVPRRVSWVLSGCRTTLCGVGTLFVLRERRELVGEASIRERCKGQRIQLVGEIWRDWYDTFLVAVMERALLIEMQLLRKLKHHELESLSRDLRNVTPGRYRNLISIDSLGTPINSWTERVDHSRATGLWAQPSR